MAIISCPPVYKKNKKQVESKNLIWTILFSKLFGNLAIRYNGKSEYTTAKKSQSHATIVFWRIQSTRKSCCFAQNIPGCFDKYFFGFGPWDAQCLAKPMVKLHSVSSDPIPVSAWCSVGIKSSTTVIHVIILAKILFLFSENDLS